MSKVWEYITAPLRAMSATWGSGRPGPADPFWYKLGWLGLPTPSGVNVSEESAMTYSAAFACTRLLSTSAACLPLALKRPREDGGNEDARNHPAYKLLYRRPNPLMSSVSFRLYGMAQQINYGNFYAEISRNELTGEPVALYPIHSSRVSYKIQESGDVEYKVKIEGQEPLYFYNQNDDSEPREILHVPSTYMREDGIGGYGVVEYARKTLGFAIATEDYGASLFKNGCRPQTVVKMNGTRWRDEDQYKTFRRMWQEAYGGPENSGKAVVLDGTMELQQFGLKNDDAQFLETRQFNIEDVARWYGVPPHLIQHLLRSTYSNIETQSIEYVIYSLIPWLRLWEETLEQSLVSEFDLDSGYQVKFNTNGLLRGDTAARTSYYREMRNIGAMSVNEIRILEDMNPIGPDGDKYVIQMNMTTLEKVGEEEKNPQPPSVPAVDDTGDTESEDDTQQKRQDAALCVLSDALKRMWTKEANAAKRAAADSTTFLDWSEKFYGNHLSVMREALAPYGQVAVLADLPPASATSLIADSRKRLEAIYDSATATGFAAKVSAEVEAWTTERITEVISNMKEPEYAGAN